jgi:S1-C subfamily serine protease
VVRVAEGSGTAPTGSIGLGFAIPIDHAARVAAELIASGQASHGWLGAQVSSEVNTDGARIISVTNPLALAQRPGWLPARWSPKSMTRSSEAVTPCSPR